MTLRQNVNICQHYDVQVEEKLPRKTFQVVSYEEAGAPSDMWSVGVIYHAMPI